MTNTRTVDNSNRPAQPEPGEDEASQAPAVREQAQSPETDDAAQQERERQTGE